MNIIPFKAGYPDLQKFSSSGVLLNTVREDFVKLKNLGFFLDTADQGFYIYEIAGKAKHTGIIVSTDINDYINGRILGHEKTITIKEQTLGQIATKNSAMSKPILLTYPDQDAINDFIKNYVNTHTPMLEVDFGDNDNVHTVWNVNEPLDVERLIVLFDDLVPVAYIADGHHRATMFAQFLKNSKPIATDAKRGLLCAYFPFSMIDIYDFSRKVQLEKGMNTADFLHNLGTIFEIIQLERPIKPIATYDLTLFINNESYLLKWKPNVLQKGKEMMIALDVEMFNTFVLQELLKITDIQNTSKVDYINGKNSAEDLFALAQNKDVAIFNFYPLTIHDVVAKAENGRFLPPKSTWFEPRVKSGLIIHEF